MAETIMLQAKAEGTLTDAQIKRLATQEGLEGATARQLIKSGQVVVTTQAENGALTLNTKEYWQNIAAKNAENLTSAETITKNFLEKLSWDNLTKSILGTTSAMIEFLLTNPVGWAILAVGAIASVVKAYDYFTVSVEEANEKISESRNKYEETTSEINSMNSELETTKQRIEELENKDVLSFTDEEELNRLRVQNDELERSIDLAEKKAKNEAAQTVSDIRDNKDTLIKDSEDSISDYLRSKSDYEQNREKLKKGLKDGYYSQAEYDKSIDEYEQYLSKQEEKILEDIENFEKDKQDIINKYGTNNISQFSKSDQNLYNDIVNQLQKAYKTIYSESEYNKFVIDPVFNTEEFSGLQEQLLAYFQAGGDDSFEALGTEFGVSLMNGLREACEAQGIDFDAMIGSMKTNAESKIDRIVGMPSSPVPGASGSDYVKFSQDQTQAKAIKDYVQNSLSDEDRTILLNADIPEDKKLKTIDEVDSFIKELKDKAKKETVEISVSVAMDNVDSYAQDLDKLMKVYDDVKDGESFDYSSILNNEDFKNSFGDYKEEYEDFIATITSSPDDIEACQDAFDRLATVALYNSNVFEGLSEATKDATIQMLEDRGIANAADIVNQRLAELEANSQMVEAGFEDVESATMDDIVAFMNLTTTTDETSSAIANLWLRTVDFNTLDVNTSGKVDQIIAIANAAGVASSYVEALQTVLARLANAEAAVKRGQTAAGYSLKSGKSTTNDINSARQEQLGAKKFSEMEDLQAWADTTTKSIMADVKSSQLSSDKYKAKTSGSYNGRNKSDSSGGGGSDSADEFSEEIDWIETKISRLEREITNLGKMADATWKTWGDRTNALNGEISKTTEQIKVQQQAYQRYMQAANSVGLNEAYAQKVRNGLIDIETITDESLKDQIDQYKNYYEAALEASDKIADLQNEIANLGQTRFDNITKEFDQLIEKLEHDITTIDNAMSLEEAKGRMGSSEYYRADNAILSQQASLLSQERTRLADSLKKSVAEGMSTTSEQYRDMSAQIDLLDEQLQENTIKVAENTKAIRELNDSYFTYQQDLIQNVIDEVDFINDMLGYKTLVNKDGSFTNEGWASMGMIGANYNLAMAKADEYGKRYTTYKELAAQDPQNKDLENSMNEALKNQQEALSAAMGYYDNMKSLVQNSLDEMINHLQDLSDKYMEGLNLEKDMFDYEKTIREKTGNIGNLQKMIAAYSGDGSEETRATLQSLYSQLKTAQEDLEETEYERWLTDQQSMLDNMLDDAQEWEAEYLESFENYLEPWLTSINEHGTEITTAIGGLGEKIGAETINVVTAQGETTESVKSVLDSLGYSTSDTLKSLLDGFKNRENVLTAYDPDVKAGVGTLNTSLGTGLANLTDNQGIGSLTGIGKLVESIKNKVVGEEKKNTETAKQTTSNTAANPSKPATTTPSTPAKTTTTTTSKPATTSSAPAWGSWFVRTAVDPSAKDVNNSIVDRLKAQGIESDREPYRRNYYYAMGGTGTYTGSAKQNIWMLNEMKAHGYYKGGKNIKDEYAWTQEKGAEIIRTSDGAMLTPLGKGGNSMVFNNAQSEALWEFSKSLIAKSNVPTLDPSAVVTGSPVSNNVTTNVDHISLAFPNVTNYEEFVAKMKADTQYSKWLQQVTLGAALGKNSFSGRKF